MSGRGAAAAGVGRRSGDAVLLVDIGNTRVKWARARRRRLGAQSAAALAGWSREPRARRALARLAPLTRVVVVSVASRRFNAAFARAVRSALGIEPEFIATTAHAAGVSNGYRESWRLGADRWVAAIAGHHLFAPARDVCVVDVGTAMTIDLVDLRGRHRGGIIVPGPNLMVRSLLAGTSGIRRRAAGTGARAARTAFARNTRGALESGARRAVAATIDRFAAEARELLGRRPAVLLTGGAAPAIAPLLRSRHRSVPDLVLRGLAVLADRSRSPPARRPAARTPGAGVG